MPRIQHKRGTSANLASVNPTPLAGELVWDSTENAIKIGDGATAWTSLAYVTATPRTHTHSADAITSGTIDYARLPVGSTTSTVCAGDDARLTDARTPTAHKASHATGGSDALTPADIGAAPAASPAITGNATFSASSGVPLTVTNTGTGNSFVVNDAAGDTTPFVVDASGRVGIGTSSPGYPLDVAGGFRFRSGTQDQMVIGADNSGTSITDGVLKIGGLSVPHFNTDQKNVGVILGASTSTDNIIEIGGNSGTLNSATSIRFYTAATTTSGIGPRRMVIDGSGNVGIGTSTTSPASRLDVNGTITVAAGTAASPALVFSGDSNTGIAQLGGADTWSVVTGNAERLRVRADGNIGIGSSGASNIIVTVAGTSSGYGAFINPTFSGAENFATRFQAATPASSTTSAITMVDVYGPVLGSGATLATSRGLHVKSTVAVAANNFGVQLSIGSGAGRWNIYADGTAQNWFAGNVGIGSGRTAPATALDVNGVITVSATSGSAGSYAPSLTFSGNANTGFGQVSGQSDTASVFTAGHERVRVDSSGNVGIGTTSPSALLDINADTIRLRTAKTPASASDTGNAGDICWDASYLYICTATNTWRRIAHSTW